MKKLQEVKGRIVVMSSLASVFNFPFMGIYSATKASISVWDYPLSGGSCWQDVLKVPVKRFLTPCWEADLHTAFCLLLQLPLLPAA